MTTFAAYEKSTAYIRSKIGAWKPKVLLILGSGLGSMAQIVKHPLQIAYGEIPGFQTSTAPSHAGQFVFGELENVNVAVMQGRLHHYEGYSFEEVAFPIRTAKLLGADTMIITNAAGGVNRSFSVGDMMLITDHINFSGYSPLCGPNLAEFGVRFPDMTFAYTPKLQDIARQAAKQTGCDLKEGVYYYMPGPSYETPAEIRAIAKLGGDAVGMSTVSEVIAARHAGMDVLGFSLISNMAAGILPQPLTEEEVILAGEKAKEKFSTLILECLNKLNV